MNTKVCKFGGSSLADANQFRKVADIINSDPLRRYVVASAPGKRSGADTKVTDMLYRCYDLAAAGEDFEEQLAAIEQRFASIMEELGITMPLKREISKIRSHLHGKLSRDYMASRGEYLNSKILAAYLGYEFYDAADAIRFTLDGRFLAEETYENLSAALKKLDRAVIPGFYGADANGNIHTFSRGGSDVTGSLVAQAVAADIYENWTDVSGMLFTDPRIVPEPQTIELLTYRELRELSYMGASVLHEDAVFPVRKAGIPINIRNTNRPSDPGTMIVSAPPEGMRTRTVTGIAGKRGFTSVHVEKSMMNGEVGFGVRLLQIFADHGIPFEHCPTGIDTMSAVVSSAAFSGVADAVMADIEQQLQPDHVEVESNLAMIAVVGRGMVAARGSAARIFR
ncbi:MAG: aspartate kinase, partial [Oscillospiraceae bacterium]|nr:aspartate kinase [Oscillospiraceae bacterium]